MLVRRVPLALCFTLPCLGMAQRSQLSQPGAVDQPYRFSTSVQMVVLQATVRTAKGGFVNGLRQGHFQVFENDQPQTVGLFRHHDSAVAIGLIVDNSGNMRRKHAAVLAAAKAFAKNSNAQDQLFVVNFNEQVKLGLPPTQLSSADSRQLERALPATTGSGKTALYDALELGMKHVQELKQDKKALILISDGGDNASTHTAEQVIADATNSDVVIYTIGLFGKYEDETNPAFLKQLADVTGGEAFRPARPGQAANNCKRIAQTIRNVYTIGYTPTNGELDGKFRAIQVKVKSPRRGTLLARTRAGYIAQPDTSASVAK
ncbi:MAG: VWA domain-containing protein [Bryobacteraceae bacterium]